MSKDYFCILPWVHLHVSQNGRVSPCCNNNRYLGNVRKQSIKEIWKNNSFDLLRKQFKNNLPDKRCSHCYNIEKSGKESLRQISNKKYKSHLSKVKSNNPEPIYLDIRFSNICNFKCKTCWHGNSSAWFEEGSKYNASNERVIKAFTYDFNEVLNYLDQAEEIYFAGGEPLIMEEHYQVLEELIKRKLFNIELRYNTNFSVINYKDKNILEMWKKFENVTIGASIDASFKLGEEIREGFNWQRFIENRKQMLEVCPEVYFEITPTVSSLNFNNIGSLHRYLVEEELLNINHIYLNILERPSEFNVQQLSEKEKNKSINLIQKHINWLEQFGAKKSVIDEFTALSNYIVC